MEPVAKGATQIAVIPRSECGRDQAGVPEVLNDVLAERNWPARPFLASLVLTSKFGINKTNFIAGSTSNRAIRLAALGDDGEPAKKSRCGIVRMPFQFRAKSAKRFLRKTALGDPVQRHQDTEPESDTAAESPCLGDLTLRQIS